MTRGPIIDQDEINRRFNYYPPNEERAAQHLEVREKLKAAAVLVVVTTPPSREQSIAITKLEEAMFWANAALARSSPP